MMGPLFPVGITYYFVSSPAVKRSDIAYLITTLGEKIGL